MQRPVFVALVLVFSLLSAACVYQAPLSQGNLLDEEDVEQVEVGMTRGQIRFLLGTPMIDDPFNKDRWDYVYYLRLGRDKAGFKRWIAVFFEDDRVVRIDKDRELETDF